MSFSYFEGTSSFDDLDNLREAFIWLALDEHMNMIVLNSKFL